MAAREKKLILGCSALQYLVEDEGYIYIRVCVRYYRVVPV
jgi:hypothetical protein